MTTTLNYLHRHVIPASFALLPETMRSPQATAMLLAIALQESNASARMQFNGPALSFWQFEVNGVIGVKRHAATGDHLNAALTALCYRPTLPASTIHKILENNDVLACVCARLNLWWLPNPLPASDNPDEGWRQYLGAWAPGKPHRETWNANFTTAWALVNEPIR